MFDQKPGIRDRLAGAVVVWLTTVTPEGQPQSSPVWFIVDGEELLVFSRDGTPRVRNIRANPRVAINLDTLDDGEDVVTMEGIARIDDAGAPATETPAFLEKYLSRITGFGWTAASFARDYPLHLRIRPTRLRTI